MMIGAPGMALPRINNGSFWILFFAGMLLISTLFMEGGAPAFGWTSYAPLSTTFAPHSTDFYIFAVCLFCMSFIMAAINIIVTILNMRTPRMVWMKMPLFVWSWLVTAFLLMVVMPVLAGAMTMMLTDRNFGTHFFNAAGGGDPVLFQHVFWFFGHPGIYIMILPAFGIISHVIPTFARKKLFGYASMVYAMVAIGFLSFLAWGQHMFTVGMPVAGELYFTYVATLIAVPVTLKVFNWIATMWRGSMTFETPMLWAVAFLFLFMIGGSTGLMLGLAPTNFQYHDTYFVVAHAHYVMVTGAVFGLFAGTYFWLPKWTGHMYDEKLSKLHFWLSVISVNILFLPQFFLGLAGMPRRIPDYAVQFTEFNFMSSIGGFAFGLSQLIFLVVVIKCIRGGEMATDEVWDSPDGLEWTAESPAAYYSFETVPEIKGSSG